MTSSKIENNNKLINECHEFMERLEYENALKCLDRVLKFEPENIEILHSKGVVLKKLGKFEESIKSFDKVLDLDKNVITALNNKGVILSELGHNQDALKCYDKVIKMKTDIFPHGLIKVPFL